MTGPEYALTEVSEENYNKFMSFSLGKRFDSYCQNLSYIICMHNAKSHPD